jgi:prepilin-type N-terminal cleavage/methylation domain-containing protein
MRSCPFRHRGGFTLVELLVVIAIIGLLVGLLLPAVQAAREASRRSTCQNNLKQVSTALHLFHDARKVMPPGVTGPGNTGWKLPAFTPAVNLSYIVRILPYMEQKSIYDRCDLTRSYDQTPYITVTNGFSINTTRLSELLCPSSDDINSGFVTGITTHIYGVLGPRGSNPAGGTYGFYDDQASPQTGPSQGWIPKQGILGVNESIPLSRVSDGTSTTLLIGELSWKGSGCYRPWTRGWDGNASASAKSTIYAINSTPYNGSSNFNHVTFGSNHSGGCHFGYADGAVVFMSEGISLVAFNSLSSRNGGESVSRP